MSDAFDKAQNAQTQTAPGLSKRFGFSGCISNAIKMKGPDDMNDERMAASQAAASQQAMAAQARGNNGFQDVVDRAVAEEREACAVLAESHGFPALAAHIRKR